MLYAERTTCRSCGHDKLEDILTLGDQYISDFVTEEGGQKAPLDLVLCRNPDCNLVQLRHTVDRDTLYRQYWYKSGINETMRQHLEEIAAMATHLADLHANDVVVDIGCNDGTLLRAYPENVVTIGFEPAKNLVEEAEVGTTSIENAYFCGEAYREVVPAKVITAIAVFYDLEDPNAFVADVNEVLDDDGLFIIQQNYLPTMLERNAFDNISHEHLEYYSLLSLEPLLHRHGLHVVDVELNDVNGGSFRTYIQHMEAGREKPSVATLRELERKARLDTPRPYYEFSKRVKRLSWRVREFVESEVRKGKTIYAYGPGNRGNVLLQSFGLHYPIIAAAAERNPDKWGRKTVGTNIPIIPEEQARKDHPDYFLILPWAFTDAFVEREREYLEKGGKFIVPLPELHLREGPP